MKCKECVILECERRGSAETECFYEEELRKQKELEEIPYWEHFRAEAAKDILCAMISSTTYCFAESTVDSHTDRAIRFADKLIAKLKEKED